MRHQLVLHIQSLLDEKLPFLALRKAGEDQVIVTSQNDDNWYKSAHDKMAYAVFSRFESNDNQVYILSEKQLRFKWVVDSSKGNQALEILPEKGKKEYLNLLENAIQTLKNNTLKKVVISRKQSFEKKDNDLSIFTKLLDTYPAANCYFFYHPQVGKWTGATPELLLKVAPIETNGTDVKEVFISTMSLAGTCVYKGENTPVWGNKEKEEQQLVTDFIAAQFKKTGVSAIEQSKVETVTAGHLQHLRTFLSGKIEVDQIEKVLNALHPTPAICGLPRDAAMDFIINNENYNRDYYTGYLGIVDGSQQEYYVNLRCMQLLEKTAIIYVGGGITAKSDAQLEYQETIAKMHTMHRLL